MKTIVVGSSARRGLLVSRARRHAPRACLFTLMALAVYAGASAPEYFFKSKNQQPPGGVLLSPQMWCAAFANGVVLRDVRQRDFTATVVPPPLGGSVNYTFGSQVEMDVSMNGGITWSHVSTTADTTLWLQHTQDVAGVELHDAEVLGLAMTLLPGVMIRESPTLKSSGGTTVRVVPGGFMVSSFFDIYIEVSTDYGGSWWPASAPARLELRGDPARVSQLAVPARLLPPPCDEYVTPDEYHLALANGILIKDVRHKLFTTSAVPPLAGAGPLTHSFDSELDFMVSSDGGGSWMPARAPGAAQVQISRLGSGEEEYYDTEMLSLSISGGSLPAGVMIRESPTEPSRGMTALRAAGGGGGGGGGGAAVQSFFDIFLEVSLDGGQSWLVPTNGPGRVRAASIAPEQAYPSDLLPPPAGRYASRAGSVATFASGIAISNVLYSQFSSGLPPPPPGGMQYVSFTLTAQMDLTLPGQAVQRVAVPGSALLAVRAAQDEGLTRYCDLEMLSLALSGLPGGVMIRESPTLPSHGRASVRYPGGGTPQIDSFFDIWIEISVDGGQTWEASSLPPMTMRLLPLLPPILGITCPANTTVQVGRVTSAVVNYPAPTAWGGCAPLTLTCVPPSGSVFPLGNTMVNGLVEDDCGQQAGCSFVVRVERSNAPAFYFPTKLQPPLPGAYVSARGGHAAFANGVVLRDFRQRLFSQSILPPPLGDSAQVAFGSLVELELSTDSGATWQPASAPADATIRLSHVADAEEEEHYDTEMLALSVSGGTLPAGVLIRESPTKASVGGRAIAPVVRGFMISSFFDIFTEVSVDGGLTWWPSTGDTLRLELRPMAELMPPVATPSRLCPPPNDAYASPPGAGIETDFGLLFRDVKTKLFSSAQPPPAAGGTVLQTMSGEIDLLYSTDNGISWLPARAPASLDLRLRRFTEGETDLCDTELERLTIAGGDLPGGVTIRESPTLPSRGMTRLADRGGGGGGAVVQSFFDIFTEVSTDGGGSWASPTNGPLRERLVSVADEEIFADSLWPPANGRYRGADQWTAYTASGLVITNFLLRSCSPSFVPPPPGMAQPCFFSAWATFSLSLDGGLTYSSEVAPVTATARLSSSRDSGFARYFDTEMLQLDIAGGTLPGGIRARESPTRPSLGRLSQHDEGLGTAYCDSFFDIFLEVSTDGGGNWEPTVTPPATLVLEPWHTPPLSIACPLDQWVRATRLGGDFVSFPPPEVLGGCPPVGVDVVPPSGSFFPDGATTVMCTATDSCGQVARCSFTVTVLPNDVPPEYAFTTNTLPPQYAEDISPRQRFAAYPNGFVLRDLRHHGFSASFPPPPPGGSATQSFSSQVDFEYSADGGLTYLPASGPAIVTIAFSNVLSGVWGDRYDTEMLELTLDGSGGSPLRLRESPTKPSLGRTTIRPAASGCLIGSFFDVYTEVSTDGGLSWIQAADFGLLELRSRPPSLPLVQAPTSVWPPPNDRFLGPVSGRISFANGVAVRALKQMIFSGFTNPPPPGLSYETWGSHVVDLQYSTDGGLTWQNARAQGTFDFALSGVGSGAGGWYDTDLYSVDLCCGDLSVLRLRESPTLPSRGRAELTALPDGTYRISSFFDIFTEVSTDGGQNWWPATSGVARVELQDSGPEESFAANTLPPLDSEYAVSRPRLAEYASGLVIGHALHRRFLSSFPPPPPGGAATHTVSSSLDLMLSTNGGASFLPVAAPATATFFIRSLADVGSVRYFDTEMLSLELAGGGLPGGFMIRESPIKASIGRTSERTGTLPGTWIDSFFDIFTEVSTDGGQTWYPTQTGPAPMALRPLAQTPPPRVTGWRAGPNLVFGWPDDSEVYQVQQATNLVVLPVLWQNLSVPFTFDGVHWSAMLPKTNDQSFFRLRSGPP